MKDILIGIDAGTSVIKSVAFDLEGRQIAAFAVPNQYAILPGGGAEQDMDQTWSSMVATLVGLGEMVEDLGSRTAAIAVTGQGDGVWLIDRQGKPVNKAWLWLDAKAGYIVDGLRNTEADKARYAKTGTGLAACQQGPQLLYMKEHLPDLPARAVTAFHCKDWLYFNLTGMAATDPSEGVFTYGDFRTRAYSDTVIDALDLQSCKRLLPPIVDGASQSYPLSPDAAALTGLLAGTPVVLGYVDVICTALGAGLYEPGENAGCTIIGSTGMHMRLANGADDVWLNEAMTGYTMCMPIPGTYTQMQSNMAATLNIDWVLGMAAGLLKSQGLERSKAELLAMADQWLADAKPANILYHPYISDAGERGPFVDVTARASFVGMSTSTSFGDLVAAVYDGLALAARDCYAGMGPLPERVRLSGGAARSKSLRRILGSALNTEIQTSQREEAGAAGAAMIAAVSIGVFDTMADCAAKWVSPFQQAVEPVDSALAALYEKAFPTYRQSRLALQPVWHAMMNEDTIP